MAVVHAAGKAKGLFAAGVTNTVVVERHSTWTAAAGAKAQARHRGYGAGHGLREKRQKLASSTEVCGISAGKVEASALRPSCRKCLFQCQSGL